MQFTLLRGVIGCAVIMGLIILVGPYSAHIDLIPDKGVTWYFWKLPEPTSFTRFMAWSGFALHLIAIWALIYQAQQERPSYGKQLHHFNIKALGVNLLFVLLHIGQTKWTYDGLAQDTHVFTSQFAVIFLLILVYMLEHKRRGLFFGKKINAIDKCRDAIRRYHGYYFAWAIIYTFWFHPIETTVGHLLGTFYTLMLLLQGSLFFTRFHTNKYWTVLLETFVLIHGAMVAYLSVNAGSPAMFLFGFLVIFVVTQVYGLGLSKRVIHSIQGVFILLLVAYYMQQWQAIGEIFKVSAGLYIGVFIFTGIGVGIIQIRKHL